MTDIKPPPYKLYRESIRRAQEKYRNRPDIKTKSNENSKAKYHKNKELINQMKEILNKIN